MRRQRVTGLLLLSLLLLAGCWPGRGSAPERNGPVAVLMYHHLATPAERPEEPGVITPERFESHLEMLKAEGYRVISADQFAAWHDGRLRLPGRSVLLTFDDGYESAYTLAFPLLQTYKAPAILFPVMKFFDTEGKGAWSPHLTRTQARALLDSGLVHFGGHSYDGHGVVPTHPGGQRNGPWLATRAWLPGPQRLETEQEYRERIREDIRKSLDGLRAIAVTGDRLHWALPNGATSPEYLDELRVQKFHYIYSTDDSRINQPGGELIHRLDAGSPHASADWLRERLAKLFASASTDGTR